MQKELLALQLPAEQIKEISAAQGTGIEALEQEIVSYLIPGPAVLSGGYGNRSAGAFYCSRTDPGKGTLEFA